MNLSNETNRLFQELSFPPIICLEDFDLPKDQLPNLYAILANWRKHRYSQFLIVSLILHSGLTPRELTLLTQNHLSFLQGNWFLEWKHQLTFRKITLPVWLGQHLRNYSSCQNTVPYLFPHPSGLKRRTARSVQKILKAFSAETGMDISSHFIRLQICGTLERKGLSSTEISQFLGLKRPPRYRKTQETAQKRPDMKNFPKAA
jgi:integrase